MVLKAIRSFAQTEPDFPASMKSMSEAVFVEHLKDHQHAIDALGSLISRSLDEGRPLRNELTSWFVAHAVKYDAHLKAVFQGLQDDCPALFRKLP
jgi:hypothetical protein